MPRNSFVKIGLVKTRWYYLAFQFTKKSSLQVLQDAESRGGFVPFFPAVESGLSFPLDRK